MSVSLIYLLLPLPSRSASSCHALLFYRICSKFIVPMLGPGSDSNFHNVAASVVVCLGGVSLPYNRQDSAHLVFCFVLAGTQMDIH